MESFDHRIGFSQPLMTHTFVRVCVCQSALGSPGVKMSQPVSYQDTHATAHLTNSPPICLYYKIWFKAPKNSH